MSVKETLGSVVVDTLALGPCYKCGLTFKLDDTYILDIQSPKRRNERVLFLCRSCHDRMFNWLVSPT